MASYGCITPWEAITFTASWVTNTTITAYGRRVGSDLECRVKVATTGAPTSANFELTAPVFRGDTLTIDATPLAFTAGETPIIGNAHILDSGTANRGAAHVAWNDSIAVWVETTQPNTVTPVTQAVPMTWANNDKMWLHFSLPISGW